MNDALCPVIAATGWQALLNAQTQGLDPVSITEVALGDQGYAVPMNEKGQATPTALQREQQRAPVLGSQVDDQQLNLHFMLEGPERYWVRELGFYLADGTLFALWSHPSQALAWKSDSVPLLLALEVVLTALPAHSVTVQSHDAPLQLIMTRDLATLGTALADLQRQQLRQADQWNADITELKQDVTQQRQHLIELQQNQKHRDSQWPLMQALMLQNGAVTLAAINTQMAAQHHTLTQALLPC